MTKWRGNDVHRGMIRLLRLCGTRRGGVMFGVNGF